MAGHGVNPDRWGPWAEDETDPEDTAFGFHIEEIPEEDEDGYTEHRPIDGP